ncbi:exopolysaccharide biosynthesis protein [Jannaschia aquimarina]|uniref:Exopolysaccharide synthesis, ExoD n=1 Tax=Jannaschia aquimarina TaxID=935700 RepID=A0A0D1D3E6_9RHOB|nr:exopolysaccharide biosynthesis protein [Jannaschia aquimarina]KIT14643.1 Exopolysaccharide synthesis, ExoD [Jannaschia aquimarina]SNT37577.1 Uncharacterized conserved protein [Jannaschia aquimarina]
MGNAQDPVDALDDAADGQDRVALGDINEELGRRSLGAVLALPAALELTPIGGVPGIPTTLALIVAIFAVQIALGRDRMWLPGFLSRREMSADKLQEAADHLRKPAAWADRHFGAHLTWLVDPPAPRFAALAILALCATVPPLEVIPFASSIPMGTIVLFGVAMILRDGRVMALAWTATFAAAISVWFILT